MTAINYMSRHPLLQQKHHYGDEVLWFPSDLGPLAFRRCLMNEYLFLVLQCTAWLDAPRQNHYGSKQLGWGYSTEKLRKKSRRCVLSTVSGRLVCSNRFTVPPPGRPVYSDTNLTSLGTSANNETLKPLLTLALTQKPTLANSNINNDTNLKY